MPGITLQYAEEQLAAYLAAERKVLKGQRVEIDGQTLQRADLDAIQNGIDKWDAKVKELSAGSASGGGGRTRVARPGW